MKTDKQITIEGIIEKYKDILSENNAQLAIDELIQHQSYWDECRDWGNYTYNTIIHILGYGYFLLKKYTESAKWIKYGLKNIEQDQEYAHKPKSQLYEILGRDYCYLLDKNNAIEAFRQMIYYDTFSFGNVAYPSVSFYSFRTANDYSIKDLSDNTISLSSIFDFNDPVDSAYFPWIEKILINESDPVQILFLESMKEAYSDYRARCFVTEKPLPSLAERNTLPYETIPPYLNTIMWAHYADYHKGFCVEYKIPSSAVSAHPKEGYVIAIHQIEYVDKMTFVTDLNFKQGFLTKSKRWEYEHEVRMLFYSKSQPDDHPIISLDDHPHFEGDEPQKAIKAVYLGYKCEKGDLIIETIKRYQPQADIYQIIVSDDDIYSLEVKKIYQGR